MSKRKRAKSVKIATQLLVTLSLSLLLAAIALPSASANQNTRAVKSQGKPDLKLRLIDKATGKPIAKTLATVYSNNGIRCVREPCPTNQMKWEGKMDKKGNQKS